MPWSKLYIKSNIKKVKELYIGTITWSWFGLQIWDEIEVFETLEEAKAWILKERTNGSLTYDLGS
jgi:hypothetical protein